MGTDRPGHAIESAGKPIEKRKEIQAETDEWLEFQPKCTSSGLQLTQTEQERAAEVNGESE